MKKQTGKWTSDIICSHNDDFAKENSVKHADDVMIGKLEEYPDCCVNQFVNNVWGDYENIAEMVLHLQNCLLYQKQTLGL